MAKRGEIQKSEGRSVERASERTTVSPPVDIYENEDEVLLVADVPGASSDGLMLHFEQDQLRIEARTGLPELGGSSLFKEFADVDYQRSFQLSPGIDGDKISAELRNGTLFVHLPKSATIKPRRIPISAG